MVLFSMNSVAVQYTTILISFRIRVTLIIINPSEINEHTFETINGTYGKVSTVMFGNLI